MIYFVVALKFGTLDRKTFSGAKFERKNPSPCGAGRFFPFLSYWFNNYVTDCILNAHY